MNRIQRPGLSPEPEPVAPALPQQAPSFGLPMIAATLATTLGAMLLAAPGGILSAVFGRFYAPPALAKVHRRVVELLAGIPSVLSRRVDNPESAWLMALRQRLFVRIVAISEAIADVLIRREVSRESLS